MRTTTYTRWWVPGDWNGFFGLFTNVVLNVIVLTGLCLHVVNLPADVVYGRILPALGIALPLGNLYYAYLAWRLVKNQGRDDVTAMPYGPSVPHMFIVVFLIMLPIYLKTHDPLLAWQSGLVWCLVIGAIVLLGAFIGPTIRKYTPRAAMLGTLAGISIAFISMRPAFLGWEDPWLFMLSLTIVLVSWMAGARLPYGLPGGLVAVLLGTALAWLAKLFHFDDLMQPADVVSALGQFGLRLPYPSTDFAKAIGDIGPLLVTAVPLGIYNFTEGMNNVESAAAAGDDYSLRHILLADGTGAIVGALLASGITIGFAAVVAARTIRALIDIFTAEPALETPTGDSGRASTYRPVLRRIGLLIVIGFALVALAGEWDASMEDLWQSEGVGRLLGRGLEITLVVLLADLAWLSARTAIDRRAMVLDTRPPDVRSGEPSDPGTRLATLFPLLRKGVLIVIVATAALISLSSLGIDIAPLLAGAGVIGVAIGFGTQTLVRDIVSGIFYLLEDAFRVGEYVEFGQIRGTVESISLRFLRLRHHRGAVHTIPFGEIRWLTNQSRDWQIMKLEFRVPFDTDIRLVKSLIKWIGEELLQDAELGPWFLEPVKSRGVIRMEEFCMVIGVKFTTRPGDGQFMVRREAYQRLLEAFAANGISFSHRHVKVEMIGDKPEEVLLPELASGAAEFPFEPPLALASSEQESD